MLVKTTCRNFIAVITHGRTLCTHRTLLRMRIHRPRLAQVDRDSSVGTANLYGLNGPRIESRWRARFSAPVQTDTGPYATSYMMGTGSLYRGVKRPGHGVDHPTLSSYEVKERVELYLYSPSGTSWPVPG